MGIRQLGEIPAEGFDDMEDHISELPDAILSSVLSSLKARDAAITSRLSRRWRSLYTSLPRLNFDSCTMFAIPKEEGYRCREYSRKFVTEVDKTLHLYLGPTMISFRIAFCFEVEFASNIDRWISFAVRMGVGKLDVNLAGFDPVLNPVSKYRYHELYLFPLQLLSEACKINYLRLHSCIVALDFNTRINSLMALDLDCVILDQRDILCIFSSCVNLEWLRLSRCRLPNYLFIRGPTISLKTLVVDHCLGVKEIVLGANNLVTFELYDRTITKLCIGNVPKLERVLISVKCSRSMTYILDKLERDLPQLTSLSILSSTTVAQSMPTSMASLRNVKQLDLFLALDDEYDLLKMIPALSACPHLQKFHLMMCGRGDNAERETKRPAGNYHLSELKEIEIGGFDGTWNQILFAQYLVENAVGIERIVIDPHYKLYVGDGKWMCGGNSWDKEKRQVVNELVAGWVCSNCKTPPKVTIHDHPNE